MSTKLKKLVLAKCLAPVDCWICGTTICKNDGVVSPRLVWSKISAQNYHLNGRTMAENHLEMPCGKCLACLARKRKDWTTRLTHELSLHDRRKVLYLTLTYSQERVPCTDGENFWIGHDSNRPGRQTLLPADVQKFLKRLRRHLEYRPSKRDDGRDHVDSIRYYCVGEYGGLTRRPHYHLMIFGWWPSDCKFFKRHKGNDIFLSSQIRKLWPFGFHTCETCGDCVSSYVARYVSKKFSRLDNGDDIVHSEFVLQSIKNGGIGSGWCDSYIAESVKRGYVTYRHKNKILKARIPDYYIKRFRKLQLSKWLQYRADKMEYISSVDLVYDHCGLSLKMAKLAHEINREKYKEIL